MKFAVFAVIASALGLATSVSGDTLRISQLGRAEEVRIRLESSGCYHHTVLYYVVHGHAPATVEISEERGHWDVKAQVNVDDGIERLGTVRLLPSDLGGLDSLLEFYRINREDGCTTRDIITLDYFRAGQLVGHEEFTDGSCLASHIVILRQDGFKRLTGPADLALLKRIVSLQELQRRLTR